MDIHRSVGEHIGKYDTLLEIVNKRKLRLFGHVVTPLRAKGTPYCRVQFRGNIKRKVCRWLHDVKECRVAWGKKPPGGKKPLLDIHKSKLDRKAYITIV